MSFIEIRNLTIDSSVDGIKFTAVNKASASTPQINTDHASFSNGNVTK